MPQYRFDRTNKLYKEMGNSKESLTKDEEPRQNSIKERLKTEIGENELMIKKLLHGTPESR